VAARQAQDNTAMTPAPPSATMLVAAGLALASAIELLILRTFTRTAIHIPGIETLREPYELVSLGGRYAYYVSVVLLLVALPGIAWQLWGRGTPLWRGIGISLAAFALLSAMAAFGIADRFALDITAAGAIATVTVAGAALTRRAALAAPAGLFAAAFVLSSTHTIAQTASQEGLASIETGWALTTAEVLGAAFALATPLLVSKNLGRGPALIGMGVALVTWVAFLGNGGNTARFLLLWSEGLSGVLPSVVYAAAAGCMAATIAALLRMRNVAGAAGLVLLVTGGIGLHSTYQSGLAITGMALLVLALPHRPESRGYSKTGNATDRLRGTEVAAPGHG